MWLQIGIRQHSWGGGWSEFCSEVAGGPRDGSGLLPAVHPRNAPLRQLAATEAAVVLCHSFLSGLAPCRQREQQFAILIPVLSFFFDVVFDVFVSIVLDQPRNNCSATERPRIVRGGRQAALLGTKEPHRVRLPRQVFPGLHQDGRRPTGELFRMVLSHKPSCKPYPHPRVVLLRLLMSSLQSTLLQRSDCESKSNHPVFQLPGCSL